LNLREHKIQLEEIAKKEAKKATQKITQKEIEKR